jgi:predicted enzyme related to lactoylglutathione lyase
MHSICHIEFQVTDVARSQTFYEGLFGWTFRSFGGDMVVFGQGEKHIGGLQKTDEVKAGESPSVWFDVEDVETMLDKAVALGGALIEAKKEVPTVGFSGQVADPDGNPIGMVQFA